MGTRKELVAGVVGGCLWLAAGEAEATVYVMQETDWLPFAVPGMIVGAGGLTTTIGAGVALDDGASMGWSAASIVLGSLNLISASVYFSVSAAAIEGNDSEALPRVFMPTAIANASVGVAGLVVGALGVDLAGGDEVAMLPVLSFDPEGQPYAAVVGRF